MAACDPGGEKRASGSQDFARSLFSRFFFRVTYDGQSKRGTIRSLNFKWQRTKENGVRQNNLV